jgi:hypothetical protein
VLGERPPSNKRADIGTITHKALEVMAHVSVCRRKGDTSYLDDAFGHVEIEKATPEWAIEQAYNYYTKLSTHHTWTDEDFQECRKWMWTALRFNGGQYDPRNLNVIMPEQRFDFIIDEPWAQYDYTLADGTSVKGNMGIKGTIDLIVEDPYDPKIIEIIDWKTGLRKDWGKEGWAKKTYEEIRWDSQLCLYHYAATRLFPEAEEIFITIFYIKDGGPFRLCFEPQDIHYTKELLRNKFEEIKRTEVPKLNVGKKCTSFCYFGKNQSPHDPSKTICEFYKDQVKEKGILNVMQEYGVPGSFNAYGDAAGRKGSL